MKALLKRLFRRYDVLLTIVLFLLVIPADRTDWLVPVEDQVRDFLQPLRWSRASPALTAFRGDDVVLVTFDDAFYDEYAAPPPRRVHYGVLVRNLGQLGAKVVVIDAPMDQPSLHGADAATARMFAQTRNVVLRSTIAGEVAGGAPVAITYPVTTLRGTTHSGYVEHPGRANFSRMRVYPQVTGEEDGWPLAVQALALYRDVTPQYNDGVLSLGELRIALDRGTDLHIDYPRLAANTRFLSDAYSVPVRRVLKLQSLLPDEVVELTFALRGKIVLVGDVSEIAGDVFETPAGAVHGVEMIAAAVHTLLNGAPLVAAPEWIEAAAGLALLAFILATAWIRQHLVRLLLTSTILGAYATAVAFAYAEFGLILGLVGNLTAGVLGAVLISVRMAFSGRRESSRRRPDGAFETLRLEALALQGQGKLDEAFEKFREMPLNDVSADLVYNLGLSYERKRLFTRAVEVYRHLAQWDVGYKDIAARLAKGEKVNADPRKAARSLGATMAPPGADLPVSSFGRFKVVEKLGETTMGAVYRGLDPDNQRPVAINTMSLSRTFGGEAMEEGRQRFLHEARLAGQLEHPNIVAIYDSGQEGDLAYVVEEYFEGHDVGRYTLKGKLLPLDVVLDVLAQCADALDYAHGKGVVHREVEPSNILYDPSTGKAKLTDFGVAHVVRTGVRSSVRAQPNYMSPEEADGGEADFRSDLFSIGAVLYQLSCGELPFQGDSIASLRYKIVNDAPPDIMKIDPRVPATVRKVLDNALRKDPRRRYPNGAKFAEHLRLCKQRLESSRKSA